MRGKPFVTVSVQNSIPMPKVTIYTRPMCSYCSRAVSLLTRKGADLTEIEAGFDPELRREMNERVGGGYNTFPQIFIGDPHVGGGDDLMELEDEGRLDAMLAQ